MERRQDIPKKNDLEILSAVSWWYTFEVIARQCLPWLTVLNSFQTNAFGDLKSCKLLRHLRIHWKHKTCGDPQSSTRWNKKHLEILNPVSCWNTFESSGKQTFRDRQRSIHCKKTLSEILSPVSWPAIARHPYVFAPMPKSHPALRPPWGPSPFPFEILSHWASDTLC